MSPPQRFTPMRIVGPAPGQRCGHRSRTMIVVEGRPARTAAHDRAPHPTTHPIGGPKTVSRRHTKLRRRGRCHGCAHVRKSFQEFLA